MSGYSRVLDYILPEDVAAGMTYWDIESWRRDLVAQAYEWDKQNRPDVVELIESDIDVLEAALELKGGR